MIRTLFAFLFGISLTVSFGAGVYVGIQVRSIPFIGGVAETLLDRLHGGDRWF